MTFDEIVNDPDFLNLPDDQKKKVLADQDHDFSSLPAEEQDSVISDINSGGPQETPAGPEVPPQETGALQKIDQVATTPVRGWRGIAVGANKLMDGVNPLSMMPGGAITPQDTAQITKNVPGAIERASEAVQPGFAPNPNERLATALGEAIGVSPYMFALAGPTASMGMAFQVLANGSASSAMTALMEKAEKGDVVISDVGLAGLFGALAPIVQPGPEALGQFLKDSVEFLDTATSPLTKAAGRFGRVLAEQPVASGSTITREAMGELADDPKLLEHYKGTAEHVTGYISKAQELLKDQINRVGQKLNAVRLKFGITKPFESAVEDAAANGFPKNTSQEMAQEFETLERGWEKKGDVKTPYTLGASGEKPDIYHIPPRERVERLYNLRHDIDQFGAAKFQVNRQLQKINSPDKEDVFLRQTRDHINPLIDKITPSIPGASMLRTMDEAYSSVRDLYGGFLEKLSNKDEAVQVMSRIAKKGPPEEIIGADAKVVKLFDRLKQKTGQDILGPFRKELASYTFKNAKAKSTGTILNAPVGAIVEGIGGENVANALNFIHGRMNILEKLKNATVKPVMNAVSPALEAVGNMAGTPAGKLATASAASTMARGRQHEQP